MLSISAASATWLVPSDAPCRALPRRRRTPASIEYRPRPLVLRLEPVEVDLPELGPLTAPAEATIFDFAAVSVALHIPIRLTADALAHLAEQLSGPGALVAAAREAVRPLYEKLLPAIEDPEWSELSEEYFVFQVPLGEPLPSVANFTNARAAWLANLVHLEVGPLSPEEIAEALPDLSQKSTGAQAARRAQFSSVSIHF
jgi:hypothetical protein